MLLCNVQLLPLIYCSHLFCFFLYLLFASTETNTQNSAGGRGSYGLEVDPSRGNVWRFAEVNSLQ